mmetsp:Transcript_24486/g.35827  ORF Transcript_24486/g.35827 Transcript_24486/m.35827 type:complete len:202 (+) Transcript_24486:100-705(+)
MAMVIGNQTLCHRLPCAPRMCRKCHCTPPGVTGESSAAFDEGSLALASAASASGASLLLPSLAVTSYSRVQSKMAPRVAPLGRHTAVCGTGHPYLISASASSSPMSAATDCARKSMLQEEGTAAAASSSSVSAQSTHFVDGATWQETSLTFGHPNFDWAFPTFPESSYSTLAVRIPRLHASLAPGGAEGALRRCSAAPSPL